MKLCTTLGLFLLASCVQIKADDLLVNSDFSNGGDGWSGDSGGAGAASNPFDNASTASTGLVVPLKSDLATRIYQHFPTGEGPATFTLVCTPSADCKFTGTGKVAKVAGDLTSEVESISYQDANGQWRTIRNPNYQEYMSTFDNVTMLIVDHDKNEVHPDPLRINPSSAQPQTITFPMTFAPHQDLELYIAFPPGTGSITLNRVSLVKGIAPVASATLPPPNSADNILAKSNWSGDVADADKTDDMGGMDISPTNPEGEVTVKLKPRTVARVSTTFRATASPLRFTIVCTPSSRCEYSGSPPFTTVGDIIRPSTTDNSEATPFTAASAPPVSVSSEQFSKIPIVGAMTLILVDQKTNEISALELSIKGAVPQTQTDSFPVSVTPNDDYTLFLAFPTGRGILTLNHVFLVKAAPGDTNFAAPAQP